MKLAVIGSGPIAILTAQYFDELGAEVVLFQRSPLGGKLSFFREMFPEMTIQWKNESLTLKNFFENTIVPAVNHLETYQVSKQGDVLRTQKRFIHKNEEIQNHTRLFDLFRVTFSLNPRDTILKQLKENPEMFNQLGEEVIQSLHKPVENFLDFDLVVEARGYGRDPLPLGNGGSYALNELNLKDGGSLFYEHEIFTKLSLTNKRSIVLVGSHQNLNWALLRFKKWIESNSAHEIHLICSELQRSKSDNPWIEAELDALLKNDDEKFEQQKIVFESEIRKWRDLEDYIKVKVPMPIDPKKQIKLYFGFEVTSVDRLLDREGLFATIERPDFRETVRDQGGPEALLTLAADAICVANGFEETSLGQLSLRENEPGYFLLNDVSLQRLPGSLDLIKENLMTYFKRASEE